jgi:hypothetical protein
VLSISAQTEEDLLQQLALIDISVPPIDKGRTTEHCERWSICRLIATITKNQDLEFPIKLMKRERPDFCLHIGQKQIGIEFTEAIQPDYARARVLPEAGLDESILDPSLFKWGAPKRSLQELRSIASEKKLTGPGWEGDEIEVEWSEAIFDTIKKKSEKLISKGFGRYGENWLSIYDNVNSFSLDIDTSISMLSMGLREYWSNESFDKIYVETGEFISEISKENVTKIPLNDLWKNK